MLRSVIRILYHRSEKLMNYRRRLRHLVNLIRSDKLAWLLSVAEHRIRYNISALYAGVMMNRNGEGDIYNLRRNIHRIEKGLMHEERKQVFAEEYIYDLVHSLERLKMAGTCDENTLIWGEGVLDQYFEESHHTEKVAEAYKVYLNIKREGRQPPWHPYPANFRPELAIGYEDLWKLAVRRRSVRHYVNKEVEFAQVQQAMVIAALSPSSCNRQSFKYLFYNDKDVVSAILKTPGGYEGFTAPSVVIVVGCYRGYFDERDANAPLVDASLSVMAFIFALETLGLSSVCINWPSLPDRDEAIRELVRLEDDEFVIMLIGVGYASPMGKVAYSAKRNIEMLISCNERIIRG